VRCRTDGEREIVQIVISNLDALALQSRALRNEPAVEIVRVGRPTTGKSNHEEVHAMLYTIAVVLLILWLLGLVTSYTLGGFIHILLVIAVVMVLVNLISGRRAL
jgi:hypothetical protein